MSLNWKTAISGSPPHAIFGVFRRILNSIGRFALALIELAIATIDSLVFLFPRPTSASVFKILVLRPDGIGDYCLWLSSAKALRDLYEVGKYEIHLVANEAWAELAQQEECFDVVLPLNRRRFIVNPVYRYRFLLSIRRIGALVCIHPVHSREFLKGDSLARLCGAKRRIGSHGDQSNNSRLTHALGGRWYTDLVRCGDAGTMELQRNASFMHYLGAPQLATTSPAIAGIGQLPDGLPSGGYYLQIPGASKAGKQWPAPRFAEIASLIHSETGWDGVVCGGGGETDVARRVVQLSDAPMHDLTNRTTITELVAVIAAAKLVVSNDTGAVHLAAAVNTPAVCILGGWHYGRYHPYKAEDLSGYMVPTPVIHEMPCFGCNWRCIYSVGPSEPKPCVGEITVESVWRAVRKVLHDQHVPRDQGTPTYRR